MGDVPGWYPDPRDGSVRRYWDGVAWHDAVPVRPGPVAAKSGGAWKPLLIICGAAIVLGAVVMVVGGGESKRTVASGGSGYSESEIRAGVISTCQDDIRGSLRDPGSAKFSEWQVRAASGSTPPPPGLVFHPAAGDKHYSAGGLVNARNGFGGYAGDAMYSCSAVVTSTGTVRAVAHPAGSVRPAPTFRQPG